MHPHTHFTRVRASVYVLQRLDRVRFKVGWALDPRLRARQLPEYGHQQIDLHRSSVLWLPSRHRAEQVERSMQKMLEPYRSPADHQGPGFSEWFDGIAHHLAVRLLGQMPVDVATGVTGRLLPLEPDFEAAAQSSGGVGALEVWWALEDLWLRAAHCMAVTVELQEQEMRIVIHRLRANWEPPAAELRGPLIDIDTYRWCQDGQHGSYVSFLHNRGDDLVCTLTRARVIEGWPEGGDLICLVRAFVLRLREMAAPWRQP